MQRLFTLIIMMLGLLVSACSGSKTSSDGNIGVELTDADEFFEEEKGDVVAENVEHFSDSEPSFGKQHDARVVAMSSDLSTYTIQKNETLMLIAFKLYGDYSKWKELAQLNSGKNIHKLKEGDTLQYYAPVTEFVWNPVGNPYLIKGGDTLGTISRDTYGETKYWRDIWGNNRPLIKDPNKIYVGFTIYTPELGNREVASEK